MELDPYGLSPEQREDAIETVLNKRAEVIVDGMMNVLDHNPWITPRVAHAPIRRLTRRYGAE